MVYPLALASWQYLGLSDFRGRTPQTRQNLDRWGSRYLCEWYLSHFYFGSAVTILMILSLAIVPEIYQDRKHRFRAAHSILNSFAVILFVGQGLTGARDLLEIPLSWQEPVVYSCDFHNQVCGGQQQ